MSIFSDRRNAILYAYGLYLKAPDINHFMLNADARVVYDTMHDAEESTDLVIIRCGETDAAVDEAVLTAHMSGRHVISLALFTPDESVVIVDRSDTPYEE